MFSLVANLSPQCAEQEWTLARVVVSGTQIFRLLSALLSLRFGGPDVFRLRFRKKNDPYNRFLRYFFFSAIRGRTTSYCRRFAVSRQQKIIHRNLGPSSKGATESELHIFQKAYHIQKVDLCLLFIACRVR